MLSVGSWAEAQDHVSPGEWPHTRHPSLPCILTFPSPLAFSAYTNAQILAFEKENLTLEILHRCLLTGLSFAFPFQPRNVKELSVFINSSSISRLDATGCHHSAETALLEGRRHIDIKTQGSQPNQPMYMGPQECSLPLKIFEKFEGKQKDGHSIEE